MRIQLQHNSLFNSVVKKATLVVLAAVLAFSWPLTVLAAGEADVWQTSANTLPASMDSAGAATYNGYAYVVGGSSSGNPRDSVYIAQLGQDGSVGEWAASANALPQAVTDPAVTTYDGYIYVAGGRDSSLDDLNTVYYAAINGDGTLGSWSTSPQTLPVATSYSHAVAFDGYLYIIGGYQDSARVDTVYYAPLDGAVGPWSTSANAIPEALLYKSVAVAENGYVYVMGGDGNETVDTVHYAELNANGSGETGTWATSPNALPDVVEGAAATSTNGYLYVMGGERGLDFLDSVYYAKANSNGSVGPWVESPNTMPGPRSFGAAAANGNFIYHFAGVDDSPAVTDSVFYTEVTPSAGGPDMNGDGTPDNDQPFVESFISPKTGEYVVLEVNATCEITQAAIEDEAEGSSKDAGFDYPSGLMSFEIDCGESGFTATIRQYYFNDVDNGSVLRKYNPALNSYATITDSSIQRGDFLDQPTTIVTYMVTDGGDLDVDGEENGVIVDPVGLASLVSGVPNTGFGGSALR
ncbi:MAG TPA: choice-of-anchor U domain-containing protein [Candidatus Saccharimonadaceae bacterium]|nr:choice-of-anchor U domain-containing protein [Candidatus Saccharimonadaceae bacterium]